MEGTPELQSGSERLGRFLRQLRMGYGYTLRRVEEQSQAYGAAIDNSQLSRFEKGKSAPSFEKLRVLARVFNVPVQLFSDILDLSQFDSLRPDSDDPEELYESGLKAYRQGDYGRSFIIFEHLAEFSTRQAGSRVAGENLARARYQMAVALKKMGRLSMAENELRRLLRCDEGSYPASLRVRALLQLSFVYRELGDLSLASVLARECHLRAVDGADQETVAAALNTAGIIEEEQGHLHEAAGYFREALEILREFPHQALMRITVQSNLGGVLAASGKVKAGSVLLEQAMEQARARGYRRATALCLSKLARTLSECGKTRKARALLKESDHLAGGGTDQYHDILFINAYLTWKISRREHRVVEEKILFGRMKYLRANLESRFKEVDQFDTMVRGERKNA